MTQIKTVLIKPAVFIMIFSISQQHFSNHLLEAQLILAIHFVHLQAPSMSQ